MIKYTGQSLVDDHGKELLNTINSLSISPELKMRLDIMVKEVICNVAIDVTKKSRVMTLEVIDKWRNAKK